MSDLLYGANYREPRIGDLRHIKSMTSALCVASFRLVKPF